MGTHDCCVDLLAHLYAALSMSRLFLRRGWPKASLHPFVYPNGPRETRRRRDWAISYAMDIATGYGEKPHKPVILGLASILLFASAYWLGGILLGHDSPEFGESLDPLDIDFRGMRDALIYSVATFAHAQSRRPRSASTIELGLILSSLQALFGISIVALFVWTLGTECAGLNSNACPRRPAHAGLRCGAPRGR